MENTSTTVQEKFEINNYSPICKCRETLILLKYTIDDQKLKEIELNCRISIQKNTILEQNTRLNLLIRNNESTHHIHSDEIAYLNRVIANQEYYIDVLRTNIYSTEQIIHYNKHIIHSNEISTTESTIINTFPISKH
jgi:hypothetical protein